MQVEPIGAPLAVGTRVRAEVDGADGYRVTITDAGGARIFSTTTRSAVSASATASGTSRAPPGTITDSHASCTPAPSSHASNTSGPLPRSATAASQVPSGSTIAWASVTSRPASHPTGAASPTTTVTPPPSFTAVTVPACSRSATHRSAASGWSGVASGAISGGTIFAFVMNQSAWDRIPKNDQAAIERVSGEYAARLFGRSWDQADRRGVALMQAAGVSTIVPGKAFVDELRARVATLERKWIVDARARGLANPEQVLREFRAEVARLQ